MTSMEPSLFRTVFFVGMNNKRGMTPLDSRTRSGKTIDSIADKIDARCIKTNLFEKDYLPNKEELVFVGKQWHEKYKPGSQDVIVLLGTWVETNFERPTCCSVVTIPHPASFLANRDKNKYIQTAIEKIRENL